MNSNDLPIIPYPQSVDLRPGKHILHAQSNITWKGPDADSVAGLLAEYIRVVTGFQLPIQSGTGGTIHLEAEKKDLPDQAGFVDERYKLTIDKIAIKLSAQNATGLARGVQSLRQLILSNFMAESPQINEWCIPAVVIKDFPRFRWRGQHLDVSRHFFSVDEVCKFIDLLALHRLNTFHLHLTDDQGWRIEINKYPLLTAVGAVRESTLIGHSSDRPRNYDETPYGGYFSQSDIKTIINFASQRHITVLPEIDMPGHMLAAIAAYPELGNTGNKPDVLCHWGVSEHVLNVEDSTIRFMKDVITEIMDLFPSKFIHIGGDEVPKKEWIASKAAQTRISELNLSNEDELQSWFITQINEHILSAGKRLIGWDEIVEGGLPRGAAVMSWRGEKGGIRAAELDHDVVMTPQEYLYFDHYQSQPVEAEPLAIGGYTPLDQVYAYNPIPDDLPEEEHHHILGCQGQLWTEYIPTFKHLKYMGFPRICALSETLWTDPLQKDYDSFRDRLAIHKDRLRILGEDAYL